MDQFGRFNFKIQDWLRHFSLLPFDFEFPDDRSLDFPTFIERIAFKVQSLELQNIVLDRATSNESEEDDLPSAIRRSTTLVIFLILFFFLLSNKKFYDSKKNNSEALFSCCGIICLIRTRKSH
jgi:hypothetical protein